MTIGGYITAGIAFITGIDVNYMRDLYNSIVEWIGESFQEIYDLGSKIGKFIVNGIGNILGSSGEWLLDKMTGTLDWIWNQLPGWFKDLVDGNGNVHKPKKEDTKKGKFANDGSNIINNVYTAAQMNQGNAIVINLNIDAAVAQTLDRRMINMLTDEMYNKLVKDMRLARA